MRSCKISRTERSNQLRPGLPEDVEIGAIEVVEATTEMTVVVVDVVIPEAIVILMIGRSEERTTEPMVSRTIITNATEDTSVMEIARGVAVVEEDVRKEADAIMTEIAIAETGKSDTYEVGRLSLTKI